MRKSATTARRKRSAPNRKTKPRIEEVEASDLQALVERLLASPLSLATVGPILHVARFDAVAEKFTVPSSKAA